MSIKISVVTPSFNQGEFINATLESVSTQTFKNVEHIIVDPGSTDSSLDAISKYVEKTPNARAIIGRDTSQMHAINIGFEEANGDVVCWLNSDDTFFDETVLQEVANRFEADASLDVLYGRGKFIDPDGNLIKDAYINTIPEDLDNAFLTSIGILQPSLFMRKRAVEKAGEIRQTMQYSFDYEYWVRLLRSGAQYSFIEKYMSRAVIHLDAKTMRARETSLQECINVAQEYYGFAPIEWVRRLEDFRLNDNDGIVKHSPANEQNLDQATQRTFLEMNARPEEISAVAANIFRPTAEKSWELVRKHIGTGTWLITAFDQHYFDQGVTLLSGLFRQGHTETPKIVFDLGLTEQQVEFLLSLKNTYVIDFARYAFDFEDWYFSSKNYVYKNFAMAHALRLAGKSDLVLWVDAGVYPTATFDKVLKKAVEDEVFFVDHDDRPNWPFHNATFTTDDCLRALKATNAESAAHHLCSCLMGVIKGSKYESLFEEAFIASRNSAAAIGNKHPPALELVQPLPKDELILRRKDLLKASAEIANIDEVRRTFGYYGHRQDQSLFSILAARHSAPLSSALQYCAGSDNSSVASKLNYLSGGFSEQIVPTAEALKQFPDSATIHHRGLFLDHEHLVRATNTPEGPMKPSSIPDSTDSEFPRSAHAGVDETAVVGYLLANRKGRQHVMLDVGAHFGTSAVYFDELGWSIHCFEPDPNNRAKLVARFGNAPNVSIDPRAVSDKPATGLEFFTSEESTGISGLHAFRETHTVTATVDATTVAEIVKDRDIPKVDFLKIDVEGFDLSVLKGVPWETLCPDVIECEFEDAKTLRLGHDWRFIADFLTSKGYTVYVSEWHPIIRYGIAHDWRRVVPYDVSNLESDAWGNFLAFREDPGIKAVSAAFKAKVSFRAEETATKVAPNLPAPAKQSPQSPGSVEKSVNSSGQMSPLDPVAKNVPAQMDSHESRVKMLKQTPGYEPRREGPASSAEAAASPGNAWYSGIAHQIRVVSPGLFDLLRFLRRSVMHLFRKPALLLPLLIAAGLLIWLSIDPALDPMRPWLFIGFGGAVLAALLVYVAHRAHFHAEQLHLESQALQSEVTVLKQKLSTAQTLIARGTQQATIEYVRDTLASAVSPKFATLSATVSALEADKIKSENSLNGLSNTFAKALKDLNTDLLDKIAHQASAAQALSSNTSGKLEAGIEAVREELKDLNTDLLDKIAHQASAAQASSSNTSGKLEAVREEVKSLYERASSGEENQARVAASLATVRDLGSKLQAAQTALQEQQNQLSAKVDTLDNSVRQQAEAGSKVTANISAMSNDLGNLSNVIGHLSDKLDKTDARIGVTDKWAQFDNTRWFQHFNRRLSDQQIHTLESEWRKRLSLPMSKQVLGYMASRACDIERHLDGRLATSVEDILLRTLVARAVKGKTIDVLEIGTLFATGAAIMYDTIAPHFEKTHFTLLDPLEGYYNQAQADILTGQIVDEGTVRRNLARVGMKEDEYTLIRHLSTDPEAIEAASRKSYDVLVIDGDHSYAGVKTDFENYVGLVKLGGYIILDDYNSPDWPDVKEYVDSELVDHEFVSRVGASWRTCVYRVVKTPAAARKSSGETRRKSASARPRVEQQEQVDDTH